MIPENKILISDLEVAKKVLALYEALEDLDVQRSLFKFCIADEIFRTIKLI